MNILLGIMGIMNISMADPCGMVPPISTDSNEQMIARNGIQRTYVMHKNGIETMALHPAFTGKVQDFGMLIPFPTPPELYKINDEMFVQLERAISPPTIEVYQYDTIPVPPPRSPSMDASSTVLGALGSKGKLRTDEVRVREEALGMYQVAVIEAGSAQALKKWMQEHKYQFPDGMEEVAQDYVKDEWAFVAIKTQIGAKSNVEPNAGMRSVDTSYPEGASFDGYVQGMGFRFPSDEVVVPMRLSVFNGRNPHNIVYLFSEKQMRINKVDQPEDYYYLPGENLYKNLTQPLKTDIRMGSIDKLNEDQKRQLDEYRNPDTITKDVRLFLQSDLMALRSSSLLLESETREKELLSLSETFDLRGEDINILHSKVLEKQRERQTIEALLDLTNMHLSIFSGVLPNNLIQEENLRFSPVSSPQATKLHQEDSYRIKQLRTYAYQQKPLSSITIPDPYQNLTVNRPPLRTRLKVAIQKIKVIKGSGDLTIIERVLKRSMNQLRYCYQRDLARNPSSQGIISVLVTIGKNGKNSTAISNQSTINNSRVESCFVGRFKRFQYPDTMEGTQFRVSFTLSR